MLLARRSNASSRAVKGGVNPPHSTIEPDALPGLDVTKNVVFSDSAARRLATTVSLGADQKSRSRWQRDCRPGVRRLDAASDGAARRAAPNRP
jgi:hypothetical protein